MVGASASGPSRFAGHRCAFSDHDALTVARASGASLDDCGMQESPIERTSPTFRPFGAISPGEIEKLRLQGDVAALLELLEDPQVRDSAKLRKEVIQALASGPGAIRLRDSFTTEPKPDPRAIEALARTAVHDVDQGVRRLAVFGLRYTGDSAALPGLLAGLRSPDTAARLHAIDGLSRLQSREVLPELIACLDEHRGGVSAWAAEALVAIRDERALGPLQAAAKRTRLPWRRRRLLHHADKLQRAVGLGP
jgi:HEAT repeat protein